MAANIFTQLPPPHHKKVTTALNIELSKSLTEK